MRLLRLKKIFDKVKRHDYIGEAISQYEHALQCAYFAEKLGHSRDVIIASLLHDIGHVALETPQPQMAELGVINHEWIGARLALDIGLSRKVADLIGYHVEAKRYLAAKKESYKNNLSEASRGTLKFQGGPMSQEEQSVFEALPYFKEILQVRTNDEKGKDTELQLPDFDHFMLLIDEALKEKKRETHEKVIICIDEKEVDLRFTYDMDIILSGQKTPIGSQPIYDFNLSVKPENPHFFLFLDETVALIEESTLSRYGLITSSEWIIQAHKRYPELNWRIESNLTAIA